MSRSAEGGGRASRATAFAKGPGAIRKKACGGVRPGPRGHPQRGLGGVGKGGWAGEQVGREYALGGHVPQMLDKAPKILDKATWDKTPK